MENTPALTLPCITLNGSSANSLMEQYSEARLAVVTAMATLENVDFHSRDYCQQENGPMIYRKAREEYHARLQKLSDVAKELETIMMHLNKFTK